MLSSDSRGWADTRRRAFITVGGGSATSGKPLFINSRCYRKHEPIKISHELELILDTRCSLHARQACPVVIDMAHRANFCRQQAKKCRAKAIQTRSVIMRREYLKLAQQWDTSARDADYLEQLAKARSQKDAASSASTAVFSSAP